MERDKYREDEADEEDQTDEKDEHDEDEDFDDECGRRRRGKRKRQSDDEGEKGRRRPATTTTKKKEDDDGEKTVGPFLQDSDLVAAVKKVLTYEETCTGNEFLGNPGDPATAEENNAASHPSCCRVINEAGGRDCCKDLLVLPFLSPQQLSLPPPILVVPRLSSPYYSCGQHDLVFCGGRLLLLRQGSPASAEAHLGCPAHLL